MSSTAETSNDTAPVDIASMRETVGRLLPRDVEQPTGDELATLTSLLRGQMELIIPEVRALAVRLPKTDVPRNIAIACVNEARGRLGRMAPAPGRDALVYARYLARSLNALVDHYENLSGVSRSWPQDSPPRAPALDRSSPGVGLEGDQK